MNETEVERIAVAANALRPDWPIASLRTLLGRPELVNRPRRDVAVALTWVACESETQTPARVLEAGPWWIATNAEGDRTTHRHPPKPHEECGKHPGQYRLSCGGCAADKREVREQREAEQAEEARMRREEAIRKAREDAAAAKAARATEEDE